MLVIRISVFLEVFETNVVAKIKAHILWSVTPPKIVPCMIYVQKYCKAGQATDSNKIRRMRTACWIPKATNTHSEYVLLIVLPLQQWLHARVSMLH